jgi:hypothetical protein
LDSISDYFDVSTRDKRRIELEFDEWVEKQKEEFVEANWENYDADDEDHGRSLAEDYFDPDDYSFSKWIKEEHENTEGFVSAFALDPIYGYVDGDSDYVYAEEPNPFSQDTNWSEKFKDNLEKYVVSKVKDPSEWDVVEDTSITSDNNDTHGFGAEIVSPPQKPDIAFADMDTIFSLMDQYDLETNKSTGFHINISIPNIWQRLDPLKLIMFMGDKHTLRQFDRLKNTYTVSQWDTVLKFVKETGKITGSKDELAERLQELAEDLIEKTGKYYSVNLKNLINGYLEFRSAGGKNYHQKFDELKETAERWLTAIDIACDPNAERREYLKKLSKVAGSLEIDMYEATIFDFIKFLPSEAAKKEFESGKSLKFVATNIIVKLLTTINNANVQVTAKMIKDLRGLLKLYRLKATDLLDVVPSNQQKAYEGLIKKFKLA